VTPAPLTITAVSQSKQAGQPNPTLTVSYTSFVQGDTSASLTSPPSVTTTATTASSAGSYPIMVSGAASPNYAIRYVDGTLTVTPEAAPVTVALKSVVYTVKTNKKGKPDGKPVFGGFQLQYSTTMNAATARLAADYRVYSKVTKRIKKMNLKTVAFTTSYNATTNTVTLDVKSSTPFAQGGEIVISGVTDIEGTPLNPNDDRFTIEPKAKGITLA
jgi:MBG domain (YGX type)